MPTTPNPNSTPSNMKSPLRILFLHGYTQTPTLFRAKTRALEKHLSKHLPNYALQLCYPAGPWRLDAADIPGSRADELEAAGEEDARAWWRRKDHPVKGGKEGEVEIVYEGLEEGMAAIAEAIRTEGPFNGVIGFSQGACAAGMVASLLEGRERREAFEERERAGRGGVRFPPSFLEGDRVGEGKGEGFVQGPLKFAVAYCGFKAPGERYQAFYEPKIKTPVLHVLGAVDVVVEEERSRGLVGACEGGEGRVVTHPGGHFVPSQKAWLDAVAGFVAECMEGKSGKDGEGKDEKVEDMDVPF